MTELFPQIVTSRRLVPNIHPITEPTPYRIAFIGEAPGEDEEAHTYPFVGRSGQLFNKILAAVGIDRNRCFVGNVCQVRPPANKIELFAWDGPEIRDGVAQLTTDLNKFQPNICVLLGNTPLRVARGKSKITAWRGSLFNGTATGPLFGVKCIATIHPTFALREYKWTPLIEFDFKRALEEGSSPSLILPQRELITSLDAGTLCYIMDTWPAGQRCSVDIEGGLPLWLVNAKALKKKKEKSDEEIRYGWPCVSICARPTKSYTIAWSRFTEAYHVRVLQSFARLMGRRDVPKVLQNQLYDNFVLSFGYGIPIRNVAEDVMIKSWEIYAELRRSLAVQASIYTREPYWKDDSMYDNTGEALFQGCARDSAVTLEIAQVQDTMLSPTSLVHYRKMIEIQNPFLYMELRGIKYDQDNVNRMLSDTQQRIAAVGDRLAESAGTELRGPGGSLSSQRLCKALYVSGNYPPQYKKEEGRKTDKLTTDIEALLTLKRHAPKDTFLDDILLHRHLEGIRETLQITADADGRVRCGYSLEAETGRVKCYTSPTGSGANLQTIQEALRSNYTADKGYDFGQCDLEGADGWTVAAHAARLGDPTMWEDYKAGMKPAKIIGLLYWFGQEVNRLSRVDLKWLHDNIFPYVKNEAGDWLYLGCKRVQHGSSYLMGIPTMCLNVLKDSYKKSGIPIYMEQSEARRLQEHGMFARYPGVRTLHSWAESKLVADGQITTASGHTRVFFGRRFGPDIKDTVKELLAHEPQMVTTWATNLAMLNLWNDPDNRIGSVVLSEAYDTWRATRNRTLGGLIIEPLHQVHDALCVQWPQTHRDWARRKMREYFQNKITVAERELIIPFDGKFGPSWGTCTTPI